MPKITSGGPSNAAEDTEQEPAQTPPDEVQVSQDNQQTEQTTTPNPGVV
jgi:hypothetical protein